MHKLYKSLELSGGCVVYWGETCSMFSLGICLKKCLIQPLYFYLFMIPCDGHVCSLGPFLGFVLFVGCPICMPSSILDHKLSVHLHSHLRPNPQSIFTWPHWRVPAHHNTKQANDKEEIISHRPHHPHIASQPGKNWLHSPFLLLSYAQMSNKPTLFPSTAHFVSHGVCCATMYSSMCVKFRFDIKKPV